MKKITPLSIILAFCIIACQNPKDNSPKKEITQGYTDIRIEKPDTAIITSVSTIKESTIDKKKGILPQQKERSSKPKQSTKPNHQKHQATIKEVLTKLIAARGIKPPNGTPSIVITPDIGKSPAAALLDKQELHIHPKTIKLCQNFGEYFKDALAAILGHELVHFYQQGQCTFSYPSPQADSIEYEADLQGLFNAYLAGYQIKGTNSTTLQMRLVDSIYQAFELDNEMYGYPSKAVRKNLVKQAEEQVAEYRMLFEAAIYAMLRGSFQIAIESYGYLLDIMDAKELNQNISTAYASFYKQLNDDRFTYPFEINTDFRLYASIRADKNGINPKEIKEKALRHFCKGATNTDEILLFEASLAIIEHNLPLAKIKLNKLQSDANLKNQQLVTNILIAKEQGKKPNTPPLSSTQLIDNCYQNEVLLDLYHPSRSIKEGFLVYFNAENGVTALNCADEKFKMHRYQPYCSKSEALQADYRIPHTNGWFHIFTSRSLILKEENGRIEEAVQVYPAFRR